MSWERMYFKKNKAYVKVDEEGLPLIVEGRAEVRYKPDDKRSYRVSPDNISPLDDPPQSGGDRGSDSKKSGKKASKPREKTEKRKAEARDEPADSRTVVAWTDGACSGNPGDAGAGVVLMYGRHRLEISRYLGQGTNNIAELTAIKIVLEKMKDARRPLHIHTDSTYSIGVLSKGWKAKKNQELVAEILAMLEGFKGVRFIKVAGHAGIEENELADELARLAVSNRENLEERRVITPE